MGDTTPADDEDELTVEMRLQLFEDKIEAAKTDPRPARAVSSALRSYAGAMRLYVSLGEDGASWGRFFATLGHVSDEHLESGALIDISKLESFPVLGGGLLKRVGSVFRREIQEFPSAADALIQIYTDMSRPSTSYDDMPPAVSGVIGNVLVELIDRVKEEHGLDAAFEEAAKFYNKNYVDHQEKRDPERPINRKIFTSFRAIVEEKLAGVSPDEAIEILIGLAKQTKWGDLQHYLRSRETPYVEALGQELDGLMVQDSAAALERIRTLQALEDPAGDLVRHQEAVFIPMLRDRFGRSVEALQAQGRTKEAETLCASFNTRAAHVDIQMVAANILGVDPVFMAS